MDWYEENYNQQFILSLFLYQWMYFISNGIQYINLINIKSSNIKFDSWN